MKKLFSIVVLVGAIFLSMVKANAAPVYYEVQFYPNNGGSVTKQIVESGKNVTPITVTRDGHTFKGWILDSTGEVYNFSTPVTSDIQLRASWEINKSEDVVTNPSTGVNVVFTVGVGALMMLCLFTMIYLIKQKSL